MQYYTTSNLTGVLYVYPVVLKRKVCFRLVNFKNCPKLKILSLLLKAYLFPKVFGLYIITLQRNGCEQEAKIQSLVRKLLHGRISVD